MHPSSPRVLNIIQQSCRIKSFTQFIYTCRRKCARSFTITRQRISSFLFLYFFACFFLWCSLYLPSRFFVLPPVITPTSHLWRRLDLLCLSCARSCWSFSIFFFLCVCCLIDVISCRFVCRVCTIDRCIEMRMTRDTQCTWRLINWMLKTCVVQESEISMHK